MNETTGHKIAQQWYEGWLIAPGRLDGLAAMIDKEVDQLMARVAELEVELETQHNAAYEMVHSLQERR